MDAESPRVPRREDLIRRIAYLWSGDCPGPFFDGRTGKRWILSALEGDAYERRELSDELTRFEGNH